MIADFFHRRQLARIGREVGERLDAHPRVQRISFDDIQAPMQVYCYQDFLNRAECRDLIAMIDAMRVPSELYRSDKDNKEDDFRTSYSCNLDRWHPDVLRIDDRICGLTGIDPRRGETLQGQRYARASSSSRITTISTPTSLTGRRNANPAGSAAGPRWCSSTNPKAAAKPASRSSGSRCCRAPACC